MTKNLNSAYICNKLEKDFEKGCCGATMERTQRDRATSQYDILMQRFDKTDTPGMGNYNLRNVRLYAQLSFRV